MNKSTTKERASNFELLRIIVMFGIVLFHYSDHSCNDITYANALPSNTVFEYFCRIGGGLGNCVFMILSGYFMLKSQFKLNPYLWKTLADWGFLQNQQIHAEPDWRMPQFII